MGRRLTIRQNVAKLPALYSTEGSLTDRQAVWLFTPDANADWLLWEYDPEERIAFGLCDLGLGFPELGSVSIVEVEELRGGFGLPVECDRSIDTLVKGYAHKGMTPPDYLISNEED